jgi:hypothetical protein
VSDATNLPASTVTDAAIVAQARLVRELQKKVFDMPETTPSEYVSPWVAMRDEQEKLDAMLAASEVPE